VIIVYDMLCVVKTGHRFYLGSIRYHKNHMVTIKKDKSFMLGNIGNIFESYFCIDIAETMLNHISEQLLSTCFAENMLLRR